MTKKEMYSMRIKFWRAEKKGMFQKPETCSDCNGKDKRIVAHHYAGYEGDNWKNIIWVCDKCHHKRHKEQYDKIYQLKTELLKPPPGFINVSEFAKKSNISDTQARKFLIDCGIKKQEYYGCRKKLNMRHFVPEDLIYTSQKKSLEIVTFKQFGALMGLTKQRIQQ
jgi:RecJ-like exonuclease